jgi:phosphatidylglycerophosphate synthase
MSLEITPNWLTVLRIALIPAGVWAIFHDPSAGWQTFAWSIFFILGMTDILDGHWARKSGRTTPLGAFLDPVADKALIGAAMISLALLHRFPWWIVVVILVREIGITIFRLAVIQDAELRRGFLHIATARCNPSCARYLYGGRSTSHYLERYRLHREVASCSLSYSVVTREISHF